MTARKNVFSGALQFLLIRQMDLQQKVILQEKIVDSKKFYVKISKRYSMKLMFVFFLYTVPNEIP